MPTSSTTSSLLRMAVKTLVFFTLLLNRVAPECPPDGIAGLEEDSEPRWMLESSSMILLTQNSVDPVWCKASRTVICFQRARINS